MLHLPSLCVLVDESWDVVVVSEIICRRMILGLLGTNVTDVPSRFQWSYCTLISEL